MSNAKLMPPRKTANIAEDVNKKIDDRAAAHAPTEILGLDARTRTTLLRDAAAKLRDAIDPSSKTAMGLPDVTTQSTGTLARLQAPRLRSIQDAPLLTKNMGQAATGIQAPSAPKLDIPSIPDIPQISDSRSPMRALSQSLSNPISTTVKSSEHATLAQDNDTTVKRSGAITAILGALGLETSPDEPPPLWEVMLNAYGMHELYQKHMAYQASLARKAQVEALQQAQPRPTQLSTNQWPLGAYKTSDHEHDRAKERLGIGPEHIDNIEASLADRGARSGSFHVPITAGLTTLGYAQGAMIRGEPKLKTTLKADMRPSGQELRSYDVIKRASVSAEDLLHTPDAEELLWGGGYVPTTNYEVRPDGQTACVWELRRSNDTSKEAAQFANSYTDRRDRDTILWETWKKSQRPQDLQALLKAMEPVIYTELARWGGQVPEYALRQQANTSALEAFRSYDPSRGASLSTHVLNNLRKLSRTVYKHQDLVRLPENVKIESTTLFSARRHLSGELGRDPSHEELADYLGWSTARVKRIDASQVGEYVGSRDEGSDVFDNDEVTNNSSMRVEVARHAMTQQQRMVFDALTGYGGAARQSRAQLEKSLGLTPDQLRRVVASIQSIVTQADVAR